MRAGPLDRVIRIERETETQSKTGAFSKTWALLASVPAAKIERSGREVFAAETTVAEADTIFRIRWSTAFTPTTKDRIVLDGRVYDIASITEIGRKVGLNIATKSRDI